MPTPPTHGKQPLPGAGRAAPKPLFLSFPKSPVAATPAPAAKPTPVILRKPAPNPASVVPGMAPPVYRPQSNAGLTAPPVYRPASVPMQMKPAFNPPFRASASPPVIQQHGTPVPLRVGSVGVNAGSIPPRVVQRVPVSLAIVESAQDHHPIYQFTTGVGGGAQTHNVDLDPWITRKGLGYDQKYVDKSQKKAIRKLITSWTCTGSIVNELVKDLVGTPNVGGVYDYQDTRRSFVGADLARHLIAVEENVKLREKDIAINCYNVSLKKTDRLAGESTETKVIGWKTLLKEARGELKKAVLAGKKCPSAMGDVTLLKTAVQNTTDPSVRDLRALGLLSDEMGLDTALKRVGNVAYEASSTGSGSFNFGYGHVRFILFLEWRICAELLLSQAVKE